MSNTTTKIVALVAVAALVLGGVATALVVVLKDGEGSVRSGQLGNGTDDSEEPSDGPTSEGPTSEGETPTPDDGATEPPDPALADFYSQQLDWSACGDNECAQLSVPLDYREPTGETIELELLRNPATDPDLRQGSLVVNPGGPGAPGTKTAKDADLYFTSNVHDHYDIVGFDPRGTGKSSPLDCLDDDALDAYIATDPAPDDPGEDKDFEQSLNDYWQGCAKLSGDLVGHVSTNEAARDMDVLRAALGEGELDYLGFSYGTRLGSTYAEIFPDKVGRFVLDGATNPLLTARQDSLSQAAGFEKALRSYVQDCLDGGDCFLGDSMEESTRTISDLLADIDDEPLPASGDRDLQVGNAFYGVVLPLYSKDNWGILDQGLKEALEGNGDTLLMLSDLYGSRENGTYADNSLEAISVINCLDDPSAATPKDIPGEIAAFKKASPTFGDVFAWGLLGCAGLPEEPAYPPLTIKAEGAAPIVVLGTTRDPATPYEEAVALAEQLESGVLVSRDGDGHTAYNKDNDCIDTAVEDYLLEGTVPTDGLEC